MTTIRNDTNEQKPKLLLIDDDDNFRSGLQRNLRKVNIDIESRNSAIDIQSTVAGEDYFLILLDVRMPHIDGFTAARSIRQIDSAKQTPIIFLSGVSMDSENIHKGVDLGAVDYIFKPYDPDLLITKIKFFCEKWKRERIEDRYIESVEALNNELIARTHELDKNNHSLESLASIVAEDIRTPLTRITTTIDKVISNNPSIPPPDTTMLQQALQDGKRLLAQLDSTITLSSNVPKNFRHIDLSILFKQVINDIADEIETQSARIHIDDLPLVYGCEALIYQLALNLITDSIQNSTPNNHPVISVSSNDVHEHADCLNQISYIDNRPGCDNTAQSNSKTALAAQYQIEQYFERSLGLHIIKRVVDYHQGKISVDYRSGIERIITISLPIHKEEANTHAT